MAEDIEGPYLPWNWTSIWRKTKTNPDVFKTTLSNAAIDPSPPGSSVIKSPSNPCKELDRGTSYGTKHQAFGQKRHFSSTRDKNHRDDCLNLGYSGLRICQTIHQLSQAYTVVPSGGFSTKHQIGILSSYRTIYQRSPPQLVKRTTYEASSG